MDPLVLLVIRHAEKPGEAWPGPGLTPEGKADKKSLVVRGWQRAGAWAGLFAEGRGDDYPVPTRLYAAKPGEEGDPDHGPSRRPAQTLQVLAERLGVPLDTHHHQGGEAALVAELLTLSGVALVAWEHKAIVADLVPRLPIGGGEPPTHWAGDCYNLVLRFDRAAGASAFDFRPLWPRLLSGDQAGAGPAARG
jgi:hypothetical protein